MITTEQPVPDCRCSGDASSTRKWLLSQLQCPFTSSRRFRSHRKLEKYTCNLIKSIDTCPFGHSSKGDSSQGPLEPVPEELCIRNLLGVCLRTIGGSTCHFGEHLSLDELQSQLELEPFLPGHANQPSRHVIPWSSRCDDCCKGHVALILEHCGHGLCLECFEKRCKLSSSDATPWGQFLDFLGLAPFNISCRVPSCSPKVAISHRLIPWPEKVTSPEIRSQLLELGAAFHRENTWYAIPGFFKLLSTFMGLYYTFTILEAALKEMTARKS